MRAKVSKFIWNDIVDISVSRLDCSEVNILKILDIFKYENVILEIGDVERDSLLFNKIKTLSINYATLLPDDSSYTYVILMVNASNFIELLHYIFATDCESFLIETVGKYIKWDQYLYNRIGKHGLIKCKFVKLHMVVVINESQIDIAFHKDIYDAKQVVLKIKEVL